MNNFNLNEIFEIAEQIEKNGSEFYKKAAEKFKDNRELHDLLLSLSDDELKHEEIFRIYKERFSDNSVLIDDIDETVLKYLHALSKQYVFNSKIKKHVIDCSITKMDVFKFAIEREKDAILFYIGLKDAMADEKDKKAVEMLVEEEKRHLTELTKYTEIYHDLFE
ncbi:MAG TPA: ferritin family protein [Victivallales bacterium]|nr:ferritin family protein [Victivallales bacterium]